MDCDAFPVDYGQPEGEWHCGYVGSEECDWECSEGGYGWWHEEFHELREQSAYAQFERLRNALHELKATVIQELKKVFRL